MEQRRIETLFNSSVGFQTSPREAAALRLPGDRRSRRRIFWWFETDAPSASKVSKAVSSLKPHDATITRLDQKGKNGETILRTLTDIRARVISNGMQSCEEAQALLSLKADDPGGQAVIPPGKFRYRRDELQSEVLNALRTGAKTTTEITEAIYQGNEAISVFVSIEALLGRLKRRGIVVFNYNEWQISNKQDNFACI